MFVVKERGRQIEVVLAVDEHRAKSMSLVGLVRNSDTSGRAANDTTMKDPRPLVQQRLGKSVAWRKACRWPRSRSAETPGFHEGAGRRIERTSPGATAGLDQEVEQPSVWAKRPTHRIPTLLPRELSRNQVFKKTLERRSGPFGGLLIGSAPAGFAPLPHALPNGRLRAPEDDLLLAQHPGGQGEEEAGEQRRGDGRGRQAHGRDRLAAHNVDQQKLLR